MTTIVIDSAGTVSVGDVLRQATDNLIELRNESGELMATMLVPGYPATQDYTDALALVENDIDCIRQRLARPAEELLTLEELMAGLAGRQH